MTLQSSGGTRATVDAAHKEIDRMIERAAAQKRVPIPASKIDLGLHCGGSDSFSGITPNPTPGVCSALLAAAGGSAAPAATTERFGARPPRIRRARSREGAD